MCDGSAVVGILIIIFVGFPQTKMTAVYIPEIDDSFDYFKRNKF